jgi:hypothetical protein
MVKTNRRKTTMGKEKTQWEKDWEEVRKRRREIEEEKKNEEYRRSAEGDPQEHYYRYRSNRERSPFT